MLIKYNGDYHEKDAKNTFYIGQILTLPSSLGKINMKKEEKEIYKHSSLKSS